MHDNEVVEVSEAEAQSEGDAISAEDVDSYYDDKDGRVFFVRVREG